MINLKYFLLQLSLFQIITEKIEFNPKTNKIEIFLNKTELIYFADTRSSNFSNLLLIEKHSWLYLTGDDFVFRLNSQNISDQAGFKERRTPTTNKAATTTNNNNINSIRLLIHRKSRSDLIVCGTNLGKSHTYDLKEADLSFQVEYNGRYLCPSVVDEHLNLGLITKSLGANLMFSALWLDAYSYGIFRKDVEYNGHFLRTLNSTKWLWEPIFVSLIDHEQFVFCFFTEFDGFRRVSRVARVCKNDQGVFLNDNC